MYKKEIQRIELILESVEMIPIPIEHLQSLWVQDIHETICYDDNAYLYEKTCDMVELWVKDSCPQYDNYGILKNPIHRLMYWQDIVYIHIFYTDDTEDFLRMPWKDTGHECNEYQTYAKHDDVIQITIKKK